MTETTEALRVIRSEYRDACNAVAEARRQIDDARERLDLASARYDEIAPTFLALN